MQQGLCHPVAFGVLHLQQGFAVGVLHLQRGLASPPLQFGVLQLGFCIAPIAHIAFQVICSRFCICNVPHHPIAHVWGFAFAFGVLHSQQGLHLGFCSWGFASAPLLTRHFRLSFAAGFCICNVPHHPIAHVWGFAFAVGVLRLQQGFAFGVLHLQQGFASAPLLTLHFRLSFAEGFCICNVPHHPIAHVWGFAFAFGVL